MCQLQSLAIFGLGPPVTLNGLLHAMQTFQSLVLEAAVGADAFSVYLEWDGGGKRTATRAGRATRTGINIVTV